MKLAEAMIGWRKGGDIKIGQWPDTTQWSAGYLATGASNREFTEATDEGKLLHLLKLFNRLVVKENFDAQKVHNAFLAVDEYRALYFSDDYEIDAA